MGPPARWTVLRSPWLWRPGGSDPRSPWPWRSGEAIPARRSPLDWSFLARRGRGGRAEAIPAGRFPLGWSLAVAVPVEVGRQWTSPAGRSSLPVAVEAREKRPPLGWWSFSARRGRGGRGKAVPARLDVPRSLWPVEAGRERSPLG
ncbi:hypothetical protein FRACA_1920021 [Frankia canadensis]|uniref:Uncharacterized protein n=1 Tax=Frankia canadensis TaxID=1836972 RepID=A0A2I2KPD0_9ACTN|nr:hypothetical protein FRACA_1920021 [Frankia canadensis]SOU54815.1 hypothetical protein FRACA_1920021 [Frankia canadensis]